MFKFEYPLTHFDAIIGEIEGRCTVEWDGELTIELRDIGAGVRSNKYVAAGKWAPEIKDYLQQHYVDALYEAAQDRLTARPAA